MPTPSKTNRNHQIYLDYTAVDNRLSLNALMKKYNLSYSRVHFIVTREAARVRKEQDAKSASR